MPSLFDQLEAEWPSLCRRPEIQRAAAPACAAVGAKDPAALLDTIRRLHPAEADGSLGLLAAQAPTCSPSARVLLQLLLPGTCRLAAKWWALGDTDERAAAAVAAVYDRIRRYRIDRRPTHIAANVLLDANQDLRRAAARATRYATTEAVTDPGVLRPAEPPERPAGVELAEVLADAVAAGVLRADDAELVAATRIGGRRLADLAAERDASLRTLQWRRRRAEDLLVDAGAAA